MISVHNEHGALLIEPAGALSSDLPPILQTILRSAEDSAADMVVLDVSGCIFTERLALNQMMTALASAAAKGLNVAVACSRPSGRKLLNSVRPPSVGVFASLGDAVQLRRYADLGYAGDMPPRPTTATAVAS